MRVGSVPTLKYYLGTGLFLVLIFSALDPAGTQGSKIHIRLLVWTLQIGTLLTILTLLHMGLQSRSGFDQLNPWLKITLSGILGSALFVPLGISIDYLFRLDEWSRLNGVLDLLGLVLEEFGGVLFPATLTWIGINAPRILGLDFSRKSHDSAQHDADLNALASPPSASGGFWAVVPRDIGRDIIYLKAELHYVRVITPLGDRLVLYSLRDAIADVQPRLDGIQTHRSYWVAAKHARQLLSEKGQKFILVSGDQRVPVSRRKFTAIKQYLLDIERNTGSPAPQRHHLQAV